MVKAHRQPMFKRHYFILCPDFHGATLLAKLLNAHPQVVCLGDSYPSNLIDQTCGCGEPIDNCSFWREIKNRVGASRYLEYPSMLPQYPEIAGKLWDRYIYNAAPPWVLRQLIKRERAKRSIDDHNNFSQAVYDLEDKPSAEVLVDGIKSLSRVKSLMALRQPATGIIHLVRDVGDFAKSAEKQKRASIRGIAADALLWRLYHARAGSFEGKLPYLRIGYEDLAGDTDELLRKTFRFMGVDPLGLDGLEPNLYRTWHFIGNSSLVGFDGRIAPRKYTLSKVEAAIASVFSGQRRGGASNQSATSEFPRHSLD